MGGLRISALYTICGSTSHHSSPFQSLSLPHPPFLSKNGPGGELRECPKWHAGVSGLGPVILRTPYAQWPVGSHLEKQSLTGGPQPRPTRKS